MNVLELRDVVSQYRGKKVLFVNVSELMENKADVSKCWVHEIAKTDGDHNLLTRSYRRIGSTWTRRRNASQYEYAMRSDSRKLVVVLPSNMKMKVK